MTVILIVVGALGTVPKSVRSSMVTVVGDRHGGPSSNLKKLVFISHSTNNIAKGMNPVITPQAMGY